MANFDFNQNIKAGRLVADPELKTTANGTPVCTFTIAVNRRRRSKSTERKADFFTVVAWRHHAEFVTRYFKKGSSIYVVGEDQTRSWTDNNGVKHYVTELVADDIRFVDSKGENSSGASVAETTDNAATYIPDAYINSSSESNPMFEEITDEDELPF